MFTQVYVFVLKKSLFCFFGLLMRLPMLCVDVVLTF